MDKQLIKTQLCGELELISNSEIKRFVEKVLENPWIAEFEDKSSLFWRGFQTWSSPKYPGKVERKVADWLSRGRKRK